MSLTKLVLHIVAAILLISCSAEDQEPRLFEVQSFDPVVVSKSNSLPTFAHYMPWFESPEFSEYGNSNFEGWGSHWTMSNINPETGSVASHYTPLIGAYDNGEPDYCEYAVTIMKLTGLDGVMIDYLSNTDFYDWNLLHEHTKEIIPWLKKAGLDYVIVYEDNAARIASENGLGTVVDLAQNHFDYMAEHFFSDQNYVHYNNLPLVLTFGPQSGMTSQEWRSVISDEYALSTLNYDIENNNLEDIAKGEFAWANKVENLNGFYSYCNERYDLCIGEAMPGFEDYYTEGGWGDGFDTRDPRNGERLRDVLEIATENDLDFLQIPTWNDWGEGTIIEPSLEFEYQRLEILQEWFGVEYRKEDLELAVKLYQKRKEHKGKQYENQVLDQVFYYLVSLQINEARKLLEEL